MKDNEYAELLKRLERLNSIGIAPKKEEYERAVKELDEELSKLICTQI